MRFTLHWLKKIATLYKGAKEDDDANTTKIGLGNVLAVAAVTTAKLRIPIPPSGGFAARLEKDAR